jgi:hypothetical protein
MWILFAIGILWLCVSILWLVAAVVGNPCWGGPQPSITAPVLSILLALAMLTYAFAPFSVSFGG